MGCLLREENGHVRTKTYREVADTGLIQPKPSLVGGKMSKPTAVIVLGEDNLTFSFTRSYLKRCGNQSGHPSSYLAGRGCGFDFVVKNFPAQVNAYRLVKARIHTWLIAVVDADTGTAAQRIGEMDRGLTQAQEPRLRAIRIQDETIARLVPRRNIETWLLALNDVIPTNDPR